jgi:hypothetical protein
MNLDPDDTDDERGGAPMRQLELDRVSCAPARRSRS